MPRRNDADIIAESLDDPDRFGELFDRHFAAITRYLQRRVGMRDGEDLAGETFATAFDRRHTFDPARGSARAWLYGIATNLLRHHLRDEDARLRLLARAPVEPDQPDPDPAPRLDAERLGRHLALALASLSPEQRDVVVLVAIEDLSYEEVAEALGIPTGTVRSRLSRAKVQLREHLESQGAINERQDEAYE